MKQGEINTPSMKQGENLSDTGKQKIAKNKKNKNTSIVRNFHSILCNFGFTKKGENI